MIGTMTTSTVAPSVTIYFSGSRLPKIANIEGSVSREFAYDRFTKGIVHPVPTVLPSDPYKLKSRCVSKAYLEFQ